MKCLSRKGDERKEKVSKLQTYRPLAVGCYTESKESGERMREERCIKH